MILMLHIIIALTSIAIAGLALVRPSRQLLLSSYGLTALTIGSGFYLVISAPAHMLESCLMGMAYITVISVATVMARLKLVRMHEQSAENV